MKQFGIILFFSFMFLCFTGRIAAQKDTASPLVTVNASQLPIEKFLLELEKQTNYHFYYDAVQFDSAVVNVFAKDEPLYKVLGIAFANTPIRFSIDKEKNVFVSKNVFVKIELPPGFFEAEIQKKKTAVTDTAITDVPDKEEKLQMATLENKLYVIGDPTDKGGPGHVTIAGYIHDSKTGEPVIGAAIFIENSKTGVITDQYGYYSVSLTRGRHILNIQSIGMADTRRQVMVYTEGKMNIDLQSQVLKLKNVTVSSEKSNYVKNLQMGVQKIDIQAIKQVPVVFGEADILRAVLTMPGVKSVGEASTGLNVRGGAADQNLILFNDATIYNPSHFFGLFSAFNPEVVKDIQLYKSSIPAKYGGRLSSVLEINSREGNKKNVTGTAGLGLLTSRINVEGPLIKDKSSFVIGARTTYANWLLNLLPNQYKNSKASFYDINLNINHEINKKNNLYLTAYISEDHFNLNNDTSYKYSNQNISLKWKHVFNNKLYSLVAGGYDRYNYGISSDKIPVNAYQLAFDVNQTYFKAHFNYFASAKHTFEFGVNSLLYKLHPGSFQPLGATSLASPIEMQPEQALESALYLSDKYTVSATFSVEAGVRYSFFNYLGPQNVNNYPAGVPKTENNILGTSSYAKGNFIKNYGGPEFRISARYAINDNLSIKAGYNTQRQYIHVLSNTTAIAPTDIWKLSDPNIKPQFGDQYSLGLYKNFKENTIETSIEVYYKTMENYLDYKSGAILVLNKHIETDVVSTVGKAYGIEFLIKKTTGKLNGWFSYTFSRTLLQMNDIMQGEPINRGEFYPANYDKPHDATLIGNYRFSHRFSVSLTGTYSTGRPITLPIGKYFYGNALRTLYSDRNAYRIPDYFRMDISMNIEGNHKVHQTAHNSWTIGVYNLTGRRNPYSVYYVTENGLINGYKLSIFGSAIPYVNYNVKF